MVDLTPYINMTAIGNVFDAMYEARETPRTWLGLSEVGNPCMRYLWYRHHGFSMVSTPGQTLRLFNLGNVLEDHIVEDLRAAGYRVSCQQRTVEFSDNGTTLRGHIDGIIENLPESSKPHLLEIKTAGEKSFKELLKAKSYEKWNPKYKGQIHVYMTGLKLHRCLVVVYNKNTSEIYSERIKIDKQYAVDLLCDVFAAIQQPAPPERLCPNAAWYLAKWCGYYKECF